MTGSSCHEWFCHLHCRVLEMMWPEVGQASDPPPELGPALNHTNCCGSCKGKAMFGCEMSRELKHRTPLVFLLWVESLSRISSCHNVTWDTVRNDQCQFRALFPLCPGLCRRCYWTAGVFRAALPWHENVLTVCLAGLCRLQALCMHMLWEICQSLSWNGVLISQGLLRARNGNQYNGCNN